MQPTRRIGLYPRRVGELRVCLVCPWLFESCHSPLARSLEAPRTPPSLDGREESPPALVMPSSSASTWPGRWCTAGSHPALSGSFGKYVCRVRLNDGESGKGNTTPRHDGGLAAPHELSLGGYREDIVAASALPGEGFFYIFESTPPRGKPMKRGESFFFRNTPGYFFTYF